MPKFSSVAEYREARKNGQSPYDAIKNGRTTRYFTETLMCMIDNKNTTVNADKSYKFALPPNRAGFVKNLRILQARFPNTFALIPATELRLDFYNNSDFVHHIIIRVPACGASAASMSSHVNSYEVIDSADTSINPINLSDADMSNLPVRLLFRGVDQKFYFKFYLEEGKTPAITANRCIVSGSLLPYLGFTESSFEISDEDYSSTPIAVYASLFPKLWGDKQQIYIRIPNLSQRNHKMWNGSKVYEDLYNVSAIGSYGQETVFEYDRDRTHMHSVAWFGNDQSRISDIDIKLTDDSDNVLDFQGQNWYLLIEIEYNVAH